MSLLSLHLIFTGSAGGAPKDGKIREMKASSAVMSHVSMCFSTKPSLLVIYLVEPVYGFILGLPGMLMAASKRHLLEIVWLSSTYMHADL